MKVLTGTQMADVDNKAINESKIDGLILMENAGIKVFKKLMSLIQEWPDNQDMPFSNVVIVSGKGNNGGDGFVIARHLVLAGIQTNVFAIEERANYTGDALKNYLAFENFGDINLVTEDTMEDFRDAVIESSIVVDALLGTGIKGPVEGLYSEVIEIINESDGIILSVDIPSGVEANTGKVGNLAVEADYTVTFAAPKLGLLLYPGADNAGKLDIEEIGIPDFLIENAESNVFMTTESYVFDLLPWRPDDSNKGTYGKVLTIAGSSTMIGAGLLTSYSALKIGAGLSTLASPKSLIPYYATAYPEITFLPLEETIHKAISASAVVNLSERLEDFQVIVLGPGLGVDSDTRNFVDSILKKIIDKNIPVVVDADALNCIADINNLKLYGNAVITPHPKELSRLLKVEMSDILDDKMKYLEMASQKYNTNVVLKGAKTLITSGEKVYINTTGNSALATGGTGDVLSGIIAGLIAQGLNLFDASVCGVYLHGLAGEMASEELTEYSVVASDVIKYLPKVMHKLCFL
ncbi:MAG: NAD(P)H-hydrate dehydratase [Cyanobacteriota bacterium]